MAEPLLIDDAADAILKSDFSPPIALQGIAIGNGWIDPREQYQGYVDFAYEKGMIKEGTEVSRFMRQCIESWLTRDCVWSIQEAKVVEKAMFECQNEVDKYANKTEIPINLANCGDVMGSVTAPFTYE